METSGKFCGCIFDAVSLATSLETPGILSINRERLKCKDSPERGTVSGPVLAAKSGTEMGHYLHGPSLGWRGRDSVTDSPQTPW